MSLFEAKTKIVFGRKSGRIGTMVESENRSRNQAEKIKQVVSHEIWRHKWLSASLAITCVAVLVAGGSLKNAAVAAFAVGLVGICLNVWRSSDREDVARDQLTLNK